MEEEKAEWETTTENAGRVDAAMTRSHSTLTGRRIEPALGQRT